MSVLLNRVWFERILSLKRGMQFKEDRRQTVVAQNIFKRLSFWPDILSGLWRFLQQCMVYMHGNSLIRHPPPIQGGSWLVTKLSFLSEPKVILSLHLPLSRVLTVFHWFSGLYRAAVPSGASTGIYEALELRDKDPKRFLGKGDIPYSLYY